MHELSNNLNGDRQQSVRALYGNNNLQNRAVSWTMTRRILLR